jgi:hypothetical protein
VALALAPHAGPARAIERGQSGFVVTALEGTTPERIPVTFLGTYEDFAGPGYDVHLIRLEGPVAERVGVAAGMSGSPVFFDGEVIGALSYRLGTLPREAVAGVTPLEDMLDAARSGAMAGTPSGAAAIAAPLTAAGLTFGARRWLAERLAPHGLVLAPAGGRVESGVVQEPFGPGSPVGVELVRGDLRIAATGTVTWVDGDRVWAFGHPFLGTGRVELPMVTAEVVHTLSDLAGSVKLSNVGQEIGAFDEDRRAALVGRRGGRASMLPVSLELSGGDYRSARYGFELARNSRLAPLLAAVTVLNTLQAAPGYDPRATLRVAGRAELGSLGELPIEMAFAGSGDADSSTAVAAQLFAVLGSLWTNPFTEITVAKLALEVVAVGREASYRIDSVVFDRQALRGGETLTVRCGLERFQGGSETRELRLTLPTVLPDVEELLFAVGNPLALDQAMGSRLQRRLQGATDIHSYLRVLGEIRSAHRLTAVVYHLGGSIVARGREFERLPPTIERLLAIAAPPTARNPVPSNALVWAEEELPGPVTGIATRRLRVERAAPGKQGSR